MSAKKEEYERFKLENQLLGFFKLFFAFSRILFLWKYFIDFFNHNLNCETKLVHSPKIPKRWSKKKKANFAFAIS